MFCCNKKGKEALLQQLFYNVNQTPENQGYIIYFEKKKSYQTSHETEPLGEFKLNLTFESP